MQRGNSSPFTRRLVIIIVVAVAAVFVAGMVFAPMLTSTPPTQTASVDNSQSDSGVNEGPLGEPDFDAGSGQEP